MSYQTRRSGNPPQQPAANVGQRRPVVTNNFVANQNQQQPQQQQQQQQPQQQRAQQQQQAQRPQQSGQPASSQVQFRQQQQTAKPQTPAQQQYNQQQQAQRAAQQQRQPQTPQAKPAVPQQQGYQTQFVKAEPATPGKQSAPVVPGANPPPPDTTNNGDVQMDTDETKKRKPWMRGGKISKKEKLRRRNLNLSKILQPKNAVMILNELVKNTHYTVEELACKVDNNQYKAVVTFEGEDHAGLGRSKIQAKNNAAENALKYLIKNKQLKLKSEPSSGDDPMDGSEATEPSNEDASGVLPWQHVASFALFKLFSSWGEDPMAPMRQAQELLGITGPAKTAAPSGTGMKPAKQLPANPELLNPIMLLNQMRPGIQFSEVGQTGTAPNVTFTYQVTVDDQTFSGTANNKKSAKKEAAFSACYNLFDIKYPAHVWSPLA